MGCGCQFEEAVGAGWPGENFSSTLSAISSRCGVVHLFHEVPPDDRMILRTLSRAALEEGRRYEALGRVRNLYVSDRGDLMQAETQGSAPLPYRQSIALRRGKEGAMSIYGACTCPVRINCKHVAAVLLAARRGPIFHRRGELPATGVPASTGAAEAPLPFAVTSWLQSLETAEQADSEVYPEAVRQRLVYVLSVVHDGHSSGTLGVDVRSLALRKDGSFGPSRPYMPHQVHTPAGYLRPSDKIILNRLADRRFRQNLIISDHDPLDLLRRIVATGRARWQYVLGPVVTEAPPRPGRVAWESEADGTQRAVLRLEPGLVGLLMPSPWYADLTTGAVGPVDMKLAPGLAARLLAAPPIPPEAAARVTSELARRLPGRPVPAPLALAEAEVLQGPVSPRLRLFLGTLPFDLDRRRIMTRHAPPGAFATALARLSFDYGAVSLPFSRRVSPPTIARDGRLYRVRCDSRGEQAALARLGGIGFARVGDAMPVHDAHDSVDDFLLDDDQDGTDWLAVMLDEVSALRADGWVVEIDDDFPFRLVEADHPLEAELVAGAGVDWLELHLGVMIDGQRLDLVPMLVRMIVDGSVASLLDGEDDATPFLLPLPDGRLLSLPRDRIRPTLLALVELFEGGGIDTERGKIKFNRFDAADLAAFEGASGIVWQGGEALRALGRQLREAGGAIPEVAVPASFQGVLRPYQAHGVAWLQFLRGAELGGVLADDMGLGKTVQTLAHLVIEQAAGRLDRPALIVCPTSLIPNWTLEAERFAPTLKLLSLHGPARKERFGEVGRHDLVLTTYPLLTRDHAALTAQDWHAVILDEAQMIKNPNAATTRQALRLQARQRICLSGTPLQNHLGELWSLFDFLAPGFLGSAAAFRKRYRTPIETHGDTERQAMLSRRVRPFLLRRTKDEVMQDLPPKTEIAEPVELGPGQRAIYEGIRLAMHARVQAAIAQRGLARSGIIILDALLKLRQACCDPRLLKLKAVQQVKPGSAKLDRLMELLGVLLGEGRRVLLFSQFTTMLELIETRLHEEGIDYVQLTGDSKDRLTPVRRFQAREVPVFLISLKAGGVGLNLTAADTVIHYDPWWNPAVEDQATDRAHRIGQDKKVFVHRLITLGTIEEKMETLKDKKRALVASVLTAGHSGALTFTETDIAELFAPA